MILINCRKLCLNAKNFNVAISLLKVKKAIWHYCSSAVFRVQRCFMVNVEVAEAEDKWNHRLDHNSRHSSCLHLDRNI